MSKDFLTDVVRRMNCGYRESARGRAKTYPLHSEMNIKILENLGGDFDARGDGMPEENEHAIMTECGSWKPDGFFYPQVDNFDLIKPKGGAVDYKAPYSNIAQNVLNMSRILKGEASTIRPYGYTFSAFLLIPDRVPYFDDNNVLIRIEEIGRKLAGEMLQYSKLSNSLDCSPDLIGMCVYKMTDFNYNTIFTKDDYANALSEYDGPIEYVYYPEIKSEGRFIYNNPNEYAFIYANMIKSKFSGTSKRKSFAELFQETPYEEQEKYLISQGKITFIPTYAR